MERNSVGQLLVARQIYYGFTEPFQRMLVRALLSVWSECFLSVQVLNNFLEKRCLIKYLTEIMRSDFRYRQFQSRVEMINTCFLLQNIMEVIHFQHPQTRDFNFRSSNSSKSFFLFCFFIFQGLAKTKQNHPDQPSLPSGASKIGSKVGKMFQVLSADNFSHTRSNL